MTTVVLHFQATQAAPVAQHSTGDRAHAGKPGSGPTGAICKDCAWSLTQQDERGRPRLKCNLIDWDWREATDIDGDGSACSYFDPRD